MNDGPIMKRCLVAVRQHCPNFRLLTIDARPEQSPQLNQSRCEAGEYIFSSRPVSRKSGSSTDEVAKAK
jgi:hypothetical protein